MESLIFQIILIGVAIGISINSEIRDGIEGGTKTQVLEKKKWHRKLSIRLLIFTFCFSIGGQVFDWYSKKKEVRKQKEDYDYTIGKLDTNINKVNNALGFLNNVRNSTHLILDSVKRQLDLQNQTNAQAKNLLLKNEQLLASQMRIYENTDRSLNPLSPFRLSIEFEAPFDEFQFKALLNYIYVLREKIDTLPRQFNVQRYLDKSGRDLGFWTYPNKKNPDNRSTSVFFNKIQPLLDTLMDTEENFLSKEYFLPHIALKTNNTIVKGSIRRLVLDDFEPFYKNVSMKANFITKQFLFEKSLRNLMPSNIISNSSITIGFNDLKNFHVEIWFSDTYRTKVKNIVITSENNPSLKFKADFEERETKNQNRYIVFVSKPFRQIN